MLKMMGWYSKKNGKYIPKIGEMSAKKTAQLVRALGGATIDRVFTEASVIIYAYASTSSFSRRRWSECSPELAHAHSPRVRASAIALCTQVHLQTIAVVAAVEEALWLSKTWSEDESASACEAGSIESQSNEEELNLLLQNDLLVLLRLFAEFKYLYSPQVNVLTYAYISKGRACALKRSPLESKLAK